ncbi:trimeric intracellular cation channel family protein [Corynebacterium otitidis]|uniref:trimeric intracellular cation channel family protein n=1 Tax=Corynebacterium otitidis TaxID=29321 RepID=UPI0006279F0B|nr:TRIC cation channel family protein [Corynebacterium otitidis]KKO83102.1 membrane protein [Corynebacterium otitidis]
MIDLHDVTSGIEFVYLVLDLFGVALNGLLGGEIARRRGFDLIGFIILGVLSGLGGGMMRDMLLDRGTAVAIHDWRYLVSSLAGALFVYFLHPRGHKFQLFKSHADCVILGLWATIGARRALQFGMPPLSCVFLGLLTACGGGMARDAVAGRTPFIFGKSPLYAVPGIISAAIMVVFYGLGYEYTGMLIAPTVGAAIAIAAFWKGWMLPAAMETSPLRRGVAEPA